MNHEFTHSVGDITFHGTLQDSPNSMSITITHTDEEGRAQCANDVASRLSKRAKPTEITRERGEQTETITYTPAKPIDLPRIYEATKAWLTGLTIANCPDSYNVIPDVEVTETESVDTVLADAYAKPTLKEKLARILDAGLEDDEKLDVITTLVEREAGRIATERASRRSPN